MPYIINATIYKQHADGSTECVDLEGGDTIGVFETLAEAEAAMSWHGSADLRFEDLGHGELEAYHH